MAQDLRQALARLRAAGQVATAGSPVDPRYELAAVLWRWEDGPALLFPRVVGSPWGAVGNVVNSRHKLALALGVPEPELFPRLVAAADRPLPPRRVAGAPCQEVVEPGPVHLPDLLPLPTFCAREGAPYLTAGVVLARHPDTGLANASINRLRLVGPDRLMIGMAPSHHLAGLLGRSRELGQPLPVAVALGNHPAVLVASNLYLDPGQDELGAAGALLGEPLAVARGLTVDVAVPAGAEWVLEGTIDPRDQAEEGPVSEFHGLYKHYGASPVLTVRAVTRRRDPLFQVIVPSLCREHLLIGAMGIEASLFRRLRPAIASLAAVAVTAGGSGRLHAVLSLDHPAPGEGKKAILAALSAVNLVKFAVAVDTDVDPHDAVAVERAVANRCDPTRDLVLVAGTRADRAEPQESGGTVTKWGLDATGGPSRPPGCLAPAWVPAAVDRQVADRWAEWFPGQSPPPRPLWTRGAEPEGSAG